MQEKNSCTIKNHQTRSRLGGWVKPSVGFLSGSVVKNPPANAGGAGDMGLTPGWRRSPGGGHGSPLQYSCLKIRDRQSSLAGYSLCGHKEFDRTEHWRMSTFSLRAGEILSPERQGYSVLDWLTKGRSICAVEDLQVHRSQSLEFAWPKFHSY